ncbi:Uma2 family endonuclease (plasmid) [Pseudoalteromonas sp. T1lg65]|uniref:Uma2 family endonuclease n=1 Tax=Pseudoalteromonas sp. T1lg65 TaxID=2077101 RepID=UPI003F7AEEB7
MPIAKNDDGLSPEAYLRGELTSTVKHELIDGQVYAMAGASANHERICQNMARKLGNHLEDSPCEPFGSDMKVRVRDNFYYPDVLVDCDFDESEPYFTTTPVIIVEVISRSTRKMDEKVKLLEYINIPTLEEYVVIEQDIADVTVYRKSDDWRSTHYFLGEDFYLKSIDCTVSVADIYRRVQNEDVRLFLEQQKTSSE